MQLMPDTARRLGVNPYDPEDNIRGGIKLIGQLTQKYSDPRVAIAAYNLGETKLDARIKQLGKTAKSITWGEIEKLLPAETRAYPGLVEQRFNAIVRA